MSSSRESFDVQAGKVYGATSTAGLEADYDRWAEDYDRDIEAVGYNLPVVVAGFFGRYLPAEGGRVLDAGCGTGRLGTFLHLLGYRQLSGIDLSAGMLARAEARGVYDDLRQMELGRPLDFPDGQFAAVTALGVLTKGHAPPRALEEMVRVTRSGGHLIFSVTEPAYEEGGFKEQMTALDRAGQWQLVETTPPFRPIPGSATEGDLMAWVFVYRKP